MSLVSGFDEYGCDCVAGFIGGHCQRDIDECLSSPCPDNYTCIDEVNHYTCFCRADWPCAGQPKWGLLAILLAVTAVLLILLLLAYIAWRNKDKITK